MRRCVQARFIVAADTQRAVNRRISAGDYDAAAATADAAAAAAAADDAHTPFSDDARKWQLGGTQNKSVKRASYFSRVSGRRRFRN